jgi:hypothetical protein
LERFRALFFCWHYSISSKFTIATFIRQTYGGFIRRIWGGFIRLRQMFPAREGVSPYRFTISMRMSKWLNPLYYWCAWQMIRTVKSQLKANEISLLDVPSEERG